MDEKLLIKDNSFSFIIGIPCCNEAQNIGLLLSKIIHTWQNGVQPQKIIVFSSASTDETDNIVTEYKKISPIPIVLKAENVRKGKSYAVNRIIDEAQYTDVIMLISGDIMPGKDCLRKLISPFADPQVGVTGGRLIPNGPSDNLLCNISRLLWNMHHHIARHRPKTTEITVFRNLQQHIPYDTLVDEAEIEYLLQQNGYKVKYIEDALIYTNAPLFLKDYLQQRTSVTLGHILLKKRTGYSIATLSLKKRLCAFFKVRKQLPFTSILLAIVLEMYIFVVAWCKSLFAKPKGIWTISKSTKRPFSECSSKKYVDAE